jgi:hypothetical protein
VAIESATRHPYHSNAASARDKAHTTRGTDSQGHLRKSRLSLAPECCLARESDRDRAF